jgi:hypothetical protein
MGVVELDGLDPSLPMWLTCISFIDEALVNLLV